MADIDNVGFELIDNYKNNNILKCDVPLMKISRDGLQIHFAQYKFNNQNEKSKKILKIESKVFIDAKDMKEFCFDIINALAIYESRYKNGLGLSLNRSGDNEQ